MKKRMYTLCNQKLKNCFCAISKNHYGSFLLMAKRVIIHVSHNPHETAAQKCMSWKLKKKNKIGNNKKVKVIWFVEVEKKIIILMIKECSFFHFFFSYAILCRMVLIETRVKLSHKYFSNLHFTSRNDIKSLQMPKKTWSSSYWKVWNEWTYVLCIQIKERPRQKKSCFV